MSKKLQGFRVAAPRIRGVATAQPEEALGVAQDRDGERGEKGSDQAPQHIIFFRNDKDICVGIGVMIMVWVIYLLN